MTLINLKLDLLFIFMFFKLEINSERILLFLLLEEGSSKEIPFFSKEDTEVNEKKHFSREASLGIPLHHLNDGSSLYLLTPAFSPPPLDSVSQWISNNKGTAQDDSKRFNIHCLKSLYLQRWYCS